MAGGASPRYIAIQDVNDLDQGREGLTEQTGYFSPKVRQSF